MLWYIKPENFNKLDENITITIIIIILTEFGECDDVGDCIEYIIFGKMNYFYNTLLNLPNIAYQPNIE